jgi:N-acetylglucosaminyldiphosphoundecaprenol N-acetyl-beta-D-mannosaminyltransferase
METSDLPESVNILGVKVDCLDVNQLMLHATSWAQETEPHTILYVNAHCMNIAWSDNEYRKILANASLVYADGVSIAWSGRLLEGKRLEKMTGADWIEEFCTQAILRQLTIYLLGGKPGVAQTAANYLQNRFAGLRIVGFADGYFQGKSQETVLDELARMKPNFLFVGMGTPIQEKWIDRNRTSIPVPVCWAVGGLFEYFSGDLHRAPGWMASTGLEWLWLFLIQPRQKWRRYLLGNPLFVYRILRQKLCRSHTGAQPSHRSS